MVTRFLKRCAIFFALVVLNSAMFTSGAQALDACQRQVLNNNILYYNCSYGVSSCSTESDFVLVNGDNIEQAYQFYVDNGLTGMQSAGIVGNLMVESHLDPTAENSIGAYGIVQWYQGRRTALETFALQSGRQADDLLVQLEYSWKELTGAYASTLADLKASTTVADAAYIIKEQYEIPDSDHSRNSKENTHRREEAEKIYARFGDRTGSGISYTSTGVCEDTAANCKGDGTATSRGAILCEARKFDPWGYLWGGGHSDPEAWMEQWNARGGFSDDHIKRTGATDNSDPTEAFEQILDCSGLITVALWNAFHVKIPFIAPENQGDIDVLRVTNFQPIPMEQTEPGDIVFSPGHVEIVSSTGAASTFGAHSAKKPPKDQIGEDNIGATERGWTKALRYVGPEVTN